MLKVKPFKQTDGSRCGPASVKMVLGYYGIDASEDDLCKHCSHTFELGCTNENMVKAFSRYGVAADIKNFSLLSDVAYYVSNNVPVIVDWFSPGTGVINNIMPTGHASVVVGLDDKMITLIDPENGQQRSINRDEFMRVWFDWKTTPFIDRWEDMAIRTMIVPYPPSKNIKRVVNTYSL